MSTTGKNVLKGVLYLGNARLLVAPLGFATTIVTAWYLGPADYGILRTFCLIAFWVGLTATMGVDAALNKEMPYYLARDELERAEYIKNQTITIAIIMTALSCAGVIIYTFIQYGGDKKIWLGMIIVLLTIMANRVVSFYTILCYIQKKFSILPKVIVCQSLVGFVVVISLLPLLGLYASLVAILMAASTQCILLKSKIPLNFKPVFDRKEIKRLFLFGFPFLMLNLTFFGFVRCDQIMIASMLPTRDMGFYSFAVAFIILAVVFFESFAQVYTPIFQEKLSLVNGDYGKMNDYFWAPTILSGYLGSGILLLTFLWSPVIAVFLPKYESSIIVLEILIVGQIIFSLSISPNLALNNNVTKKTWLSCCVYGAAAVVNIALNFFLIKKGYGMEGVAIATASSYLLIVMIMFCLSAKFVFKSWHGFIGNLVETMVPILIVLTFSLVQWKLRLFPIDNYAFKVAGSFLFALMLFISIIWRSKNNEGLRKILVISLPQSLLLKLKLA